MDNTFKNNVDEYTQSVFDNGTSIDPNTKNLFTYVDVNVGTEIFSLTNIDASTNSYHASMRMMFDFDQFDFYRMFMERRYNEIISKDIKNCHDDYYRLLADGTFEVGEDNVPDIIEIDGYGIYFDGPSLDPAQLVVNQKYLECLTYYPAEYSCNVFPNKQYMFQFINGSPVTDSFGYDICIPYSLKVETARTEPKTEDASRREFRYIQVIEFEVEMHHAFKSSTYPLDKAQLNIIICPNVWTAEYLRFVPTSKFEFGTIDITEDNMFVNTYPTISSYYSGLSPKFYSTGGYSILDSTYVDPTTDLTEQSYGFMQQDILYDKDQNGYNSPYSALKLTFRIERTGMNAFLKAYLNLFSVVIWIIIGFFSEAYQGESSLGMLGTGLFAAISSIIVGLNMVSDAGFFSLLTMINIFTLFVILLMTYQSVMAKNAKVKGDNAAIAFYGIKLRILFFILSISTLILFVGLPLVAAL